MERHRKTKKGRRGILALIGVMILALAACSAEGGSFSLDDVLTQVLQEEKDRLAYYGEADVKTYENGEVVEHVVLKEWVAQDGKRRTEVSAQDGSGLSISVNDGERLVTYLPEQNQAFVIEDEEIQALNQATPKEQGEQMLSMIRDTHELRIGSEETEVAGRKTVHLIAKAGEKGALIGDQELWIDKENWMVLKIRSVSGNTKVEMEYTHIDFEADIPPSIFTLDLPDETIIMDIDHLHQSNLITLDEAAEQLGEAFLYFPETDELVIDQIELVELEGELKRKEINIEYVKEGRPSLTLTVFLNPEQGEEMGLLPGAEKITVRNLEGTWMEMNAFRSLHWKEEGITYSVLVHDPALTLEALLQLTEQMKPVE